MSLVSQPHPSRFKNYGATPSPISGKALNETVRSRDVGRRSEERREKSEERREKEQIFSEEKI